MKIIGKIFGLLLLCTAWAGTAGPLEQASAWYLSGKDAETSRFENSKAPDDPQKEVLKLTWLFREGKGNKALWLNLKKPLMLNSEKEIFSLQIYSDAPGHRIYFECTDRDNETLLYSYESKGKFRALNRKGWQKFLLVPHTDHADTWGGGEKANKKADFPLKVLRLWIDPMDRNHYSGTLFLKDPKRETDYDHTRKQFDPSEAKVGILCGKVDIKQSRDANGAVFELKISGRDFPGIILSPQNRFWNLSAYQTVRADVENLSKTEQVDFHMRIYSAIPGEENRERTVYSTTALNPGEKKTVVLFLPHVEKNSKIHFSKPLKGAPEGVDKAPNLFTDRISRLTFYTQYPHKSTKQGIVRLRIGNIRPAIPYQTQLAPLNDPGKFFPFVDEFGQYIHSDWNGKIYSGPQLKERFEKETQELADAKRIAGWNRFGGWKNGPQLKKSGFFRTEKYRGKWWLVDPEGRLFLSNGINAVQFFDDFTVKAPEWYRTPVTKGQTLDFVRSNLMKKYGGSLFPAIYERTHKRLELWGLNTIGGWSDGNLCRRKKTPYTLVLFDNGKAPKLGRLYDPFDPEFAKRLDGNMNSDQFKWSINDPYCIGYFVNNELPFEERAAYAKNTIGSKSGTPAKKAMERFLADRYKEIESLNRSWGTDYVSWNDFQQRTALPDPKKAKRDLEDFSDRATEEYFRICRQIVKKNAPGQLYLGARFNGRCHPDMPWLFRIAARHCDVVSFNNYSNSVAQYMRNDLPDVPLIIGEFALNVRDRGMFNDHLRTAGMTQKDRVEGYLRYWQGVLVHPNLVGAHWFTWVDQPLTGRFDGENYQFGLVDCTDTPYGELASAMRLVGEKMYEYRLAGELSRPLK